MLLAGLRGLLDQVEEGAAEVLHGGVRGRATGGAAAVGAAEESLLPQPTRSPRTRQQGGDQWRALHGCSACPMVPTGTQSAGGDQPEAGLRRTPGARRRPRASGQPAEVLARDDLHHPQRRQVRGLPLHVEQPWLPGLRRASRSTSPTRATFDASVSRWNIDSPANRPPIETPYSPPASRPSHQASTECTQPRRCSSRYAARIAGSIQPAGRRGSAQASMTSADGRVDADLEPAHRPPQRPRDPQAVQGQHPAAYGREPQHRVAAPARRHREQPAPVRLQQRPRREVGTGRHQVVVGVEPRRSREPPVARAAARLAWPPR